MLHSSASLKKGKCMLKTNLFEHKKKRKKNVYFEERNLYVY